LDTYLEANLDLLGEGSFGEDGLHLRDDGGAEDATLRSDVVALLTDAGHNGKVLREVRGEDASDALLVQLFGTLKICVSK
jgi:hypothetical protein